MVSTKTMVILPSQLQPAQRPWYEDLLPAYQPQQYSHHNYSQHVDHIMRNPCHLYTSHNTTCLRLCVAADQALNHNDSTGIRNWTLYTN
ncbi:unnamed protein product [Leptidea sinapis]|uniref:Uncharacterized protein n=1 Tax=Leptidea sinapis TaxID=189913 RepID=A0A5E4QNK0_9NEOP|nr:unnamed protein product [Leptidea sinapis]